MSLLTDERTEDARQLTGSIKIEDTEGSKVRRTDRENKLVDSPTTKASTLQWPGDRQVRGETGRKAGIETGEQFDKEDMASVRSDNSVREAASWTESERELRAEGERRGGGASEEEGVGLMTHLEEEEGEETGENHLPEKAAQVFSPAVTVLGSLSSPRQSEAFWEVESEKSPFLGPCPQDYNPHGYQYKWPEDMPPAIGGRGCPNRDALKLGVSMMMSALFFPFLVWGGFVFLPFDAPLLDGAPVRLVYTLRCSVFAAVPIILGWLVLGACRLRYGAVRPMFENDRKEAELQEIAVHRCFVSDSTSLFLVYFLQLVVMAMYLSQEQLKLVPLLTIVFAIGRLIYWVAAAFGSSIRGFGFGFSFLPSLAMMVANIYFIFTMDSAGSIFSLPPPPEEVLAPQGRQRFWG